MHRLYTVFRLLYKGYVYYERNTFSDFNSMILSTHVETNRKQFIVLEAVFHRGDKRTLFLSRQEYPENEHCDTVDTLTSLH